MTTRSAVTVAVQGARPGAPVALVAPGRGYDVDQPVLRAVRDTLLALGWEVRAVAWSGPAPTSAGALAAVGAPLLDELARPGRRLVVAKSLTTRWLPLAAEREVPGFWLTPLLREPEVRDATTAITVPTVLVGGTADDTWDGAAARASGHGVLELPGADHRLEVSGDPTATAACLRAVGQALAEFLSPPS